MAGVDVAGAIDQVGTGHALYLVTFGALPLRVEGDSERGPGGGDEALGQRPFLVQVDGHYGKTLGLSGKARADIPHLAYAVSYRMDYLVTWNYSHIANGEMIRRLLKANGELNRPTPLIVTPEEILETLED